MKIVQKPFLLLIRFYQKVLSPDQGYISKIIPMQPRCGMYPTCSQYAYEAIEKYGVIIGIYKSFFRIVRCNPYQKNSIDKP